MRRGTGGKGKGKGKARGEGKGGAGGSQQSQPSPQPQPHPLPLPSPQDNVGNIEQARMQRTVIGMDAVREIVTDIVQWRAIIEAAVDGKLFVPEDVLREEEEIRKEIAEAEKRLIDTKYEAIEEFMQEVSAARQRMLDKMNRVQHEVTSVIAAACQRLVTVNAHANTHAALAFGREISNDFQGLSPSEPKLEKTDFAQR